MSSQTACASQVNAANSPQLIRSALGHSPELAALLPACRDLNSAFNELRWIREHIDKTVGLNRKRHLERLCQKRGRGVPLQYLLGTQPFGSLNIKCKPGVLIPRPETEAYVCHLQNLLESGDLLGQKLSGLGHLRIIDFCTGTGCIPLHLFSALQRSVRSLQICGVDISPVALELAQENARYNVAQGRMASSNDKQALFFQKADIFRDTDMQQFTGLPWDIMISNPRMYLEKSGITAGDRWGTLHGSMSLVLHWSRKMICLLLLPGYYMKIFFTQDYWILPKHSVPKSFLWK
uniref:Methyltransferase domain-containing protein n=1 Tax=Bionectria ochroleuca TaxID=29856 RepID=A0A8H7NGF2_BIOOC